MARFLRAFLWLRWRVFMNGLERTGRRDRLQRLSAAVESLAPIILFAVIVPGALAFGVVGFVAGLLAGRDGGSAAVFPLLLRFGVLAVLVLSALTPLLSSAGRKPEDLLRLLLLPIPRSVLFVSELFAGLSEPWIAISVPMFLTVPVGVLFAGRPGAALIALAAGLAMVATLLGLAMLSTTLLQVLMRNRRRAELFAMIVVFLPLLLSLPAMLRSQDEQRLNRERRARGERIERAARPRTPPAQGLLALVPSELYTATIARAPTSQAGSAAALGGLLVFGVGLTALSWPAFRRMLASPMAGSAREVKGRHAWWTRRLPGLSESASAVALAVVRLALRTPRGRVQIMMPMVLLLFFALPLLTGRQGLTFGSSVIDSGLGLSVLVALFGLAAIGPIALNQFAIDGAGLTLQFLAPISDRDLLAGKAAGLAIIGGAPILSGLIIAAALFPPPSFVLWFALLLAVLAAFLVLSPIWALLSAVFPRAANLNSIRSSASNPHQAANLLGLLAAAAAGGVPGGLAALAIGVFERPDQVLPLVGMWTVVAFVLGRALFVPATAAFTRRRENLAMVAQGR